VHINCKYPAKISWQLDIAQYNDPLAPFGTKIRKKITKAQSLLLEHGYSVRCEDLSEELVDKFVDIYNFHMLAIGGIIHEVKQKTFLSPPHSYPYKVISIYLKEKYLGGLIFSNRVDHLVTAYKALPHKLEHSLPISSSFVVEEALNKYAIEHRCRYIRRGKDRNLYGPNLSIGLALYKLQIGAYPRLVPNSKLEPNAGFDWSNQDTLVFLAPGTGEQITEAKLYSTKSETELQLAHPLLFSRPNLKVVIHKIDG